MQWELTNKKRLRIYFSIIKQIRLYLIILLLQLRPNTKLELQKESEISREEMLPENHGHNNEGDTHKKPVPKKSISSDPANAAETKQFINIAPESQTKNATDLSSQTLLEPKLPIDTNTKSNSLASKNSLDCHVINEKNKKSTEIIEQYKSFAQEEPEDIMSEEVDEDTIEEPQGSASEETQENKSEQIVEDEEGYENINRLEDKISDHVEERETTVGDTCPNPFFFKKKSDVAEIYKSNQQKQNEVKSPKREYSYHTGLDKPLNTFSTSLVPNYGIQPEKIEQQPYSSSTALAPSLPKIANQQCVASEWVNNVPATYFPAISVQTGYCDTSQPVCPVIYLDNKAVDTGNNLPAEVPNNFETFIIKLKDHSYHLTTSIFPKTYS